MKNSKKETDWGVIAIVLALIVLIVAFFWKSAKQGAAAMRKSYEDEIEKLNKQIAYLQTRVSDLEATKIRIAELEKSWMVILMAVLAITMLSGSMALNHFVGYDWPAAFGLAIGMPFTIYGIFFKGLFQKSGAILVRLWIREYYYAKHDFQPSQIDEANQKISELIAERERLEEEQTKLIKKTLID